MGYISQPASGTATSGAWILQTDGNDVTVVSVTSATIATKKTYSGLTFTATKMFKVRVFTRGSGTVRKYFVVRLSDGTNTSDFTEIQVGTLTTGTAGIFEFYIGQNGATTTQALLWGLSPDWSQTTAGEILAPLNTTDTTPLTLAAAGTWASLTTIILRARGDAATSWDITRVSVEALDT